MKKKQIIAASMIAFGLFAIFNFDKSGAIRDAIFPQHKYATMAIGGALLSAGVWCAAFYAGWRVFVFSALGSALVTVVYFAAFISGSALFYLIGFLMLAGMCKLAKSQNDIENVF